MAFTPEPIPHREGEQYITCRDSFQQREDAYSEVRDMITQRAVDGRVDRGLAESLNIRLRSGEITAIDVMGQLITQSSIEWSDIRAYGGSATGQSDNSAA